jgi:uncharacterized protein (TIGR03067 family)
MHALVFLLLYPAAVDPGKEAPKDLDKLQGVWKATALDSGAAQFQLPAAALAADRYTLVVAGDRYVFGTHAGTVKVDAAKGAVDLVITDGRYKGVTILGLYELKGDTLRVVMATPARAGERPTEFKSGQGRRNGHTVYTFERDKATKEAAAARLKELTATVAGAPGPAAWGPAPNATQEMLKQIIERLDRIDKRLDALEKNMAPKK